jgi:hypothetical protein
MTVRTVDDVVKLIYKNVLDEEDEEDEVQLTFGEWSGDKTMLILYCSNEIHRLQNPYSYFGEWWKSCLLKNQSECCNSSEWLVPVSQTPNGVCS